MSHNYINFHILISHSPSCLNRDDMNMQKNAVFGGKRRVRISSQSLKRAIRTSGYYQEHIGARSIRTKNIAHLKNIAIEHLQDRYDKDLVSQTIGLIAGKDVTKDDAKSDAVAAWAMEEIAWFCEQVKHANEKGEIDKFIKKKLKDSIEALNQALANCVDIALSGRMATSGLMTNVDGALAMAHAITTHEVNDSDIDWFTAVDDLQDLGSAHLDTQEFSSGVFYRYASLNIRQLQENLGNASREQTLEMAAHVLHMLATIIPTAKQQTFAAHNLADLALVSFSDLPVSLANAFECTVKQNGNGFLKPSIDKLNNYWSTVHKGYGINENCAEFTLEENLVIPEGIIKQDSLDSLKNWIRGDGE